MFIVAFAAISFLAACSGGSKDSIAHKWKFSGMQSPQMDRVMAENDARIVSLADSITAAGADTIKSAAFLSEKTSLESQKTMMNEMMEKMKTEGWIEFTKEGKFKQNMSGTEEEGTYSLDEAAKMVITTDGKGKVDSLVIDELTDSALTLFISRDSTKIMFAADAAPAAEGSH